MQLTTSNDAHATTVQPVTVALAGVCRVVRPQSEAMLEGCMLVASCGQVETGSITRHSERVTRQPPKLLDAVDSYVAPTTLLTL